MATLAVQTITRGGLNPSVQGAAGGGDAMACGPANFLQVTNGSGSTITVTLNIPASLASQAWGSAITLQNPAAGVIAGATRYFGPLISAIFQDPTTGLCSITYSAVTSVTVGAFTMAAGS